MKSAYLFGMIISGILNVVLPKKSSELHGAVGILLRLIKEQSQNENGWTSID